MGRVGAVLTGDLERLRCSHPTGSLSRCLHRTTLRLLPAVIRLTELETIAKTSLPAPAATSGGARALSWRHTRSCATRASLCTEPPQWVHWTFMEDLWAVRSAWEEYYRWERTTEGSKTIYREIMRETRMRKGGKRQRDDAVAYKTQRDRTRTWFEVRTCQRLALTRTRFGMLGPLHRDVHRFIEM